VSRVSRQRSRRPRCKPDSQPKLSLCSPRRHSEHQPKLTALLRCIHRRVAATTPARSAVQMPCFATSCATASLWTYRCTAQCSQPLSGLIRSSQLVVCLDMPFTNKHGFVASVSSTSSVTGVTQTCLRPCCTSDCRSADQTGVCAIASVSESSTSGCFSTDESVVSTPVARRRHPILPWALYPSESLCHLRRSVSHIFRCPSHFG
jgi:hypothetical protein